MHDPIAGHRKPMIGALGAGLVAGLGVAMPLGAIGALLVGMPARAGHRVSVCAALGVATTDGLYAAVAVAGGAALAAAVHRVTLPLQLLSAGVLVALALAAIVVARRPAGTVSAPIRFTPARAYVAFLALTAVNPGTLAYFLALVLGTDGALRHGTGAWFVAGVLTASAAWQLLLVGGGAVLVHVLAGPRARAGLALASAALMLALAVRVLLYALA
jgi:arginine exporter protein ArgO